MRLRFLALLVALVPGMAIPAEMPRCEIRWTHGGKNEDGSYAELETYQLFQNGTLSREGPASERAFSVACLEGDRFYMKVIDVHGHISEPSNEIQPDPDLKVVLSIPLPPELSVRFM